MHAIALQLSADELEELRKTFAAIDTDCDGTLSRAEVRAAFFSLPLHFVRILLTI